MDEQQGLVPEHAQCGYSGILGDSEDSEEELVPLLSPYWEDVCVLGRLGLSSCKEMSEEEVQCVFGQFVMAFQCDQYTLTRRLQAEEHDRAVAQENLQVELQRTKDALQVLCMRVPNDDVRGIVRQMEESLQMLENSIENITIAAETLGATHQEARVSHAVELMDLHVDHLKKRHSVESAELLLARKALQRCRGRLLSDPTEDGEAKLLAGERQHVHRRRVSVTLIPTQAQLTDLEVKFLESCRFAELDSQIQEGLNLKSGRRSAIPAVDHNFEFSPSHNSTEPSDQLPNEDSTDSQEDTISDSFPNPLQVSLRCRQALADHSSEEGEDSSTAEWSHDPSGVIQLELTQQCPLLSWLFNSRRTLMLLVFCGTLIFLLFHFRTAVSRT